MNVTNIFKITFIVLGIWVVIKALVILVEQFAYWGSYWNQEPSMSFPILVGGSMFLAIIMILGFVIILNANKFAKKLSDKTTDDNEGAILKKRSEVIQIAIIIMTLYYIIIYSPGMFSSMFFLFASFIENYPGFLENAVYQIWNIILYIIVIIIFLKSRQVSIWLDRKILGDH